MLFRSQFEFKALVLELTVVGGKGRNTRSRRDGDVGILVTGQSVVVSQIGIDAVGQKA